MNRPRFTAFALVAVGLAVSVAPSHAYRMIHNSSIGQVRSGTPVPCGYSGGFLHWRPGSRSIPWYYNTANQGSGKGTALSSAMSSWTNVSSADYIPFLAGTTTASLSIDGRNTILWSSDSGCTGSCLAITALVLEEDQVIVETDISFNQFYSWQTNGTNYDVQAVAAHEFGHSLGIHHTEIISTPRPTMYASYFGTDGRTLAADDHSALQCSTGRY